MEHGCYSQTTAPRPRPQCASVEMNPGKRPPNVVRPWEEESRNYKQLTGDVEGVKAAWQGVDAALYNYLWTTVLW